MLARVEAARKEGLKITANMYTYPAAGTGLDACLPPWTAEGGYPRVIRSGCADPGVAQEDRSRGEGTTAMPGRISISPPARPENILLVGFKSEKLKPLTGKSLAEVAKMRGKDPVETIMDLIPEDESRIDTHLLPDVGRRT